MLLRYAVLSAMITCPSMVRSKVRVHPLALFLVRPISMRRTGGDGSSTELTISGSIRGRCDCVVVKLEGATNKWSEVK